jgi:hypothetical protein
MAGEHTQQEAKYEKTKRESNMDAGKSIISPDNPKSKTFLPSPAAGRLGNPVWKPLEGRFADGVRRPYGKYLPTARFDLSASTC